MCIALMHYNVRIYVFAHAQSSLTVRIQPFLVANSFPSRNRHKISTQLIAQRDWVELDEWPRAALTLSMDGFGAPWRLPEQLLLGSPVSDDLCIRALLCQRDIDRYM